MNALVANMITKDKYLLIFSMNSIALKIRMHIYYFMNVSHQGRANFYKNWVPYFQNSYSNLSGGIILIL